MKLNSNERRSVAYFSMEIGIDERINTYSGGLGVLAGDTIRSAADLKVPMVAVTLLYRKGYFRQRLEADGWQWEEIASWDVEELLQEETPRARVRVEGRIVHLRAWRYDVEGVGGYKVPIYFLDTDLPENSEWDRGLTQTLYGGDDHYRVSQEVILGIGGVRMLRALGYKHISPFHLNEGHAALLVLELLDEAAKEAGRESVVQEDAESVRKQCVFTTHTPVPAGHDSFSLKLARKVLGEPTTSQAAKEQVPVSLMFKKPERSYKLTCAPPFYPQSCDKVDVSTIKLAALFSNDSNLSPSAIFMTKKNIHREVVVVILPFKPMTVICDTTMDALRK